MEAGIFYCLSYINVQCAMCNVQLRAQLFHVFKVIVANEVFHTTTLSFEL